MFGANCPWLWKDLHGFAGLGGYPPIALRKTMLSALKDLGDAETPEGA